MSFFNVTGNPTIITPQQSGTSYYFVTFSNPGTGSIKFNSPVSDVSYLVVGGGGGGSSGYTTPSLSAGGGGGASGDLITGSFIPILNQSIGITIGAGGQGGNRNIIAPLGNGAGYTGNPSIINTIITAYGGQGAGSENGLGGINSSYGSGGNGGQIGVDRNQTNASGYPAGFSPYLLNGYNVGNWGGGGGAGEVGTFYPISNPEGQGGIGGTSTTSPFAGTNGGGGGGGDYNKQSGASGGNGVVILSFKQVIGYYIPGGQDLSDIFYPLSLGGVTGSTGTGYNYNTGTGFQDLTSLFALYIPGSTAAPQTFYKTDYYGGHDLNQVFQNINYPFPFTIITSQYITINIYYANGYYGIIFQQNGTKNSFINNVSTPGQNGTATIQFTQSISNANILVVGGGGGGACGYNTTEAFGGGGGGGGGITLITEETIDTTQVSITVGCGGSGNPGLGFEFAVHGAAGNNSSINYNNNNNTISYTSGGGGPGYGSGVVEPGVGGGIGGSTSQTGGIDLNGGGGGGGGGAGTSTGSGPIYQGGTGGSNAASGNPGTAGDSATSSGPYNQGQNGGASWQPNIIIPFYTPQPGINITLSGGGGGGGGVGTVNDYDKPGGGGAGVGLGGIGNSSSIKNGESANNSMNVVNNLNPGYGGGGGGGGEYVPSYIATGGDGGNGVVMIWWPV